MWTINKFMSEFKHINLMLVTIHLLLYDEEFQRVSVDSKDKLDKILRQGPPLNPISNKVSYIIFKRYCHVKITTPLNLL